MPLGIALFLCFLTFSIGGLVTAKAMLRTSTTPAPVSQVKDGMAGECDVNNNMLTARTGWQCYYQDMPDGSRQGTWIIPDLNRIALDSSKYQPLLTDWKQYTSPKGEISFSYPAATWSVNTQNEKDGQVLVTMGNPQDIPPFIVIEIVPKNGVSMEDRIKEELSAPGRVSRDAVMLGGVTTTVLNSKAPLSIGEDHVSLYADHGDYYVHIAAPLYKDPLYDFPTAVLLSSITFAK